MIRVENVYKSFGSQQVLRGVTLRVYPGETLAVVGPSGAGKSVLIKLITGIMKPDSGTIYIGGEPMSALHTERDKNKLRLKLGMLFQSAALFDSMTLYENIAFPLRERGKVSASVIHEQVTPLMSALSLTEVAHNFPETVSMGVRKRAGMARALICRPEVVLFDEPNTGLDPYNGQEVYELINECRTRWGFTGVVISHELPEVFQVVNRVAMLLHGEIIMKGTPQEMIDSENPAVQQFLNGKLDGPIKIQ